MKKRAFLYTIFCSLVITCLALFLAYKISRKSNYAKSLVLNCPGEITIGVNTQIKFLDDFIKILPNNFDGQISVSSSAGKKDNENSYSFDFNDKTFIAQKEGYYYIEFSAPKSIRSVASATLKIHVVAENDDITIKKTQLSVGEQISFDNLFSLKNSSVKYNFDVENKNIINFSNNTFYVTSQGETKINFTITKSYGYIQYDMSFHVVAVQNSINPPQENEDKENEDKKDDNQDEQGNQNENKDNEQNKDETQGDDNVGGQESQGGDVTTGDKDNENQNQGGETASKEKYEFEISVAFDQDIITINCRIYDSKKKFVEMGIVIDYDNEILTLQDKVPPLLDFAITKDGVTVITISLADDLSQFVKIEIDTINESFKILE